MMLALVAFLPTALLAGRSGSGASCSRSSQVSLVVARWFQWSDLDEL